MSFVQPEPSGDPSLRDQEPELTPPRGTPASAAEGDVQRDAKPLAGQSEVSAPPAPAFSFAGFSEHAQWPLGVADAAAEFAALQANAVTPGADVPAASEPSSVASAAGEPPLHESVGMALQEAVAAPQPEPLWTASPLEAVWAPSPEPVQAALQEAVAAPQPEPVWAAASPEPAWPTAPAELAWPAAPAEPVTAAPLAVEPTFAALPAPVDIPAPSASDASDRVSIDWVPSDDTGTPAPSPVIAAPLEPLREEALNPAQSPSQPPAEGGGYLERYQRLFAGDSVDPQQAILAALDAAIQSPTSEAPRDEAPVATAPIAEAMPATAVVPAAPLTASVPEPIVKAPSAPAAPIADAAAAAAAPASSALPAAIDVAPGSQAPSKLNFEQDVDWSEDVLARAARAAAAAGERARAHQRAQIAAASAVQSRGPASERARADSGTRARSEAPPQAVSSERAARNRGRKARRARFAATPLFLFAFVGSVMVALGVGFVTGFMVGRETPKAAEASLARPLAEPAPVAAEPPAPVASEAQPATRRKGALTSRVEAVVPQSALNAQTLLGTEAASAAAPAASTAKLLRGPFDPKSAGAALSKAAARAGICVPPGDAGGEAVVTITLDPSGVTSSAAVYGARFSGTQAGECIAGLLRDVKVRPFTGDPVTVKKTIQVN